MKLYQFLSKLSFSARTTITIQTDSQTIDTYIDGEKDINDFQKYANRFVKDIEVSTGNDNDAVLVVTIY